MTNIDHGAISDRQRARLAKHGLTAIYIRADDYQSEDDEVSIRTLSGERTGYAVQVGGCGETAGWYFPNKYSYDAANEVSSMLSLGEYRTMGKAIERILIAVRADKESGQ